MVTKHYHKVTEIYRFCLCISQWQVGNYVGLPLRFTPVIGDVSLPDAFNLNPA